MSSDKNYNQLSSEVRVLRQKADNAACQVFGNKVKNQQEQVRAVIAGFNANKLTKQHFEALQNSLLVEQEVLDFQAFGLSEGDFARWDSLVKVAIRSDYTELERLRQIGEPDALVCAENENVKLKEQVKYLEQRLAEIELHHKIKEIARGISPEAEVVANLIIERM